MDKIDSRELLVNNKSPKSIFSIISPNDSLNGSSYYSEFRKGKDYTYTKAEKLNSFVFEEIHSGEKISNHDRPKVWESFLDKCENKQLRVFIISNDSVEKYGWHKIFRSGNFNRKYTLSLKDLEKQNWEIIYK